MTQEPALLGKQIKIIHNSYEESRNRQLLKYNLTAAQMDVLIYLRCNNEIEIHQREIERWLRLKNPTVTGILNRLEEKGFIVRQTNESDKRFRTVKLTEQSNQLLHETKQEMEQVNDRLYNCLTPAEKQELSRLLDKILEHIPVREN